MTAIAKITAKGQTTVPRDIRAVLGIEPGDLIAWEVEDGGRVAVRRVKRLDLEYLQAAQGTLGEWQSAEDEEAYRARYRAELAALDAFAPLSPCQSIASVSPSPRLVWAQLMSATNNAASALAAWYTASRKVGASL